LKISNFSGILLKWFEQNRRNYIWRRKTDPYEILIAEIMLQRTKATQVEPVYVDFLKKFPNLQKLNEATEKEIGEYFGRLGLLWRTTLVKRLVRELTDKFEGKVPESRNILLSLPAVGEYMADAVLSFAYDKHVAVVDVNVCRVIARVFRIKARGEARRDRKFRKIVQEILPTGRAKDFNWAIIDFAALVCTSRNPKHDICPMNIFCSYYQQLLKKSCGNCIDSL
jgi:A/G-specific adenine glycosylase